MTAEIEQRFEELCSQKNVIGALVLTAADGAPIRSSFDAHTTQSYAGMVHRMVVNTRELLLEVDEAAKASGNIKGAVEGNGGGGVGVGNANGSGGNGNAIGGAGAGKVKNGDVDGNRSSGGDNNNSDDDDVKFLRLTTKRHEVMIAPDPKYTLAVFHHIQDYHQK